MARVPETNEHALIAARRLRHAILCQLASPLLLAAACTPTPPSTDEGGVTTNPGTNDGAESPDGESEVDEGSMSESGPLDDDDGSMETDTTGKLDIGVQPDLGPPLPQCWSQSWTEMDVIAMYPDCTLGPFDENLYPHFYHVCVESVDGDCSEICPPDMLCQGMEECVWSQVYDVCGPYPTDDGSCCLAIAADLPPPEGRPFIVGGEVRLAVVRCEEMENPVASYWLEVARGEHASIAAFARFVAVLQRFGAPAKLVAEALAAAADEARHAEQALDLASHFAGRELEFGSLAVTDAMRETDDLAVALRAAVIEGCIDETLAAHEAACLAEHAEHPRVARVLQQIAADEARHAALAWKFVAWVLGERPDLRSVVVDAFASAAARTMVASDDLGALSLGHPPARVRAHWRRVGLRELIEPCTAQLFGDSTIFSPTR